MKKVLRLCVLVALPALVGLAAVFSVSSNKGVASAPVQNVGAVVVNIQNAKISSQEGHDLSLYFEVTSKKTVQAAKYGVVLIKQGKDGTQAVEDTRFYDQVVSLKENEVKRVALKYQAPAFSDGSFMLMVEVEDQAGTALSSVFAGNISLIKTSEAVILFDSCYLTAANSVEKYTPEQGVKVAPNETLTAHCQIRNALKKSVTVIPQFTAYYRIAYRSLVGNQTGDPLVLPASDSIQTFTFPKADNPETYDISMVLLDTKNTEVSNKVTFHYTSPQSAALRNIFFDKDFYLSGETAKVSFFWNGSIDTETEKGIKSAYSLSVQVKNQNGKLCSPDYFQVLDPLKGPLVNISLPIEINCFDPQGTFAIKDGDNKVLTQTSFNIHTNLNSIVANNFAVKFLLKIWKIIAAIPILAIIAAIVVYILKRGKKFKAETTFTPPSQRV